MSAPGRQSRRGQPVVALAMVLTLWIGARGALWAASHGSETPLAGPRTMQPQQAQSESEAPLRVIKARPAGLEPTKPAPRRDFVPVSAPIWPNSATSPGLAVPVSSLPATAVGAATMAPPVRLSPRIAAGHQMLFMAALAQLPMPDLGQQAPSLLVPVRERKALYQPRFSADGWLLLRGGGNGFNLPGAGLPGANLPSGAYGASQAGAVVRFHLAPSNPLRPTLYLRATSAVQSPRGEEVAAGLSLRPIPRLPVAAMAEMRATRTLSGTIARPAVALVSELPPASLPLGLRGEAYVAAGYVGGRYATGFVDGQARIERRLFDGGRWQLRAGAGTWGGAQKGAKRIDVGPTATLALPLGPANGRVSADWRFRVGGNAAPTSGPAITLSAGF